MVFLLVIGSSKVLCENSVVFTPLWWFLNLAPSSKSVDTVFALQCCRSFKIWDFKIYEEFWQLPDILYWASRVLTFKKNIYWIVIASTSCPSAPAWKLISMRHHRKEMATELTGKLASHLVPCCPQVETSSPLGARVAASATDAFQDTISSHPQLSPWSPTVSWSAPVHVHSFIYKTLVKWQKKTYKNFKMLPTEH